MVLRDDIARPHCTRIIEEHKNQHSLQDSTAKLVAGLEPYRTRVGQARLMCSKPGTSHIKTIVNFARPYCMIGTGFHVLTACTQ